MASDIIWTLESNLDVIAGAIRGQTYESVRRTMDEMLQGVRRSMRQSHQGRVYVHEGIAHQASAPGEAPAVESGELIGSLDVDVMLHNGQAVGLIFTDDPKAADLEYGTHRAAARPFLTPAGEAARKKIVADLTHILAEIWR